MNFGKRNWPQVESIIHHIRILLSKFMIVMGARYQRINSLDG